MQEVHRLIDENLTKTEGWCTPQKAHRMADIINESGVARYLELGVHRGRSLMPAGLAILKMNANKGIPLWVTGVDAWSATASCQGMTADDINGKFWSKVNNDESIRMTRSHLDRMGLQYVQLARISSLDFAAGVGDETLDMLHQDGNHTELVSQREVELYFSKVRHGGWWIFDDTNWSLTFKAQALLESKGYVCREDHGTWKVYQRT